MPYGTSPQIGFFLINFAHVASQPAKGGMPLQQLHEDVSVQGFLLQKSLQSKRSAELVQHWHGKGIGLDGLGEGKGGVGEGGDGDGNGATLSGQATNALAQKLPHSNVLADHKLR